MLQVARALDERRPSFGYCRTWEYRVEQDIPRLLDDLAASVPCHPHRLADTILLLQCGETLVEVVALGLTSDSRAVTVEIVAPDRPTGEKVIEPVRAFLERAQVARRRGFILDWHHRDIRGGLVNQKFEERVEEVLRDEAYPDLPGGVNRFINGYLDSADPVLVLQGPPGTGKTQLIRGILSELAGRQNKGAVPRVLYSSDPGVLQSDEYFIRFRESGFIAMVIEDADHFLAPRADGNATMHRFLNASDGLMRSGPRKIIFSTNLPRAADIDEALLRPGRCHAHVRLRELSTDEAGALARALTGQGHGTAGTIAEIYRSATCRESAVRTLQAGCP
jgi:hypothetical protein